MGLFNIQKKTHMMIANMMMNYLVNLIMKIWIIYNHKIYNLIRNLVIKYSLVQGRAQVDKQST